MNLHKMCKNFNNKKALLIWRDIEMNEENINNITCKDYHAPNGFSNFVNFSILYKNRDLDEYRVKYLKKTGQPWQKATIQDIYKAELVWGF